MIACTIDGKLMALMLMAQGASVAVCRGKTRDMAATIAFAERTVRGGAAETAAG
jgi:5,10-methylene-tetrahydrofolate dehydrogenase/methenyl tetrahydrofolate cyclohydrolase